MRGRELLSHLRRAPLAYRQDPDQQGGGSHRKMVSEYYPELLFAFHDSDDIAPGLVRKILVRDVGLTQEQALRHLRKGLK